MKYGKVCFAQTAPRTTEGTIISSLEEFAALMTVLATFSALRDMGEYFGNVSNEG